MKQSLGAEQTINYWIKKNNCVSSDTTLMPDVCKKDKTTSQLIHFKGDKANDVWFIKVKNGGHTCPGAKIDYLFLGKTSMDFDANELIWEFFRQHPLQWQSSFSCGRLLLKEPSLLLIKFDL